VADNLDLGRPESVELIFKRDPRGRKANGTFKTAINRHTDGLTVNVFYKHSRIGSTSRTAVRCASRPSSTTPTTSAASACYPTSTTCRPRPVRSTSDCWTLKRVGQGTVLASPAFARIAQSTVTDDGSRPQP
jgi:hypothetical protein